MKQTISEVLERCKVVICKAVCVLPNWNPEPRVFTFCHATKSIVMQCQPLVTYLPNLSYIHICIHILKQGKKTLYMHSRLSARGNEAWG